MYPGAERARRPTSPRTPVLRRWVERRRHYVPPVPALPVLKRKGLFFLFFCRDDTPL
nr:MAG TPA: hypothetical protein [Caudoviricetes sp.]